MKDFHCWWGKWVGGKPRGQKGSGIFYRDKYTIAGGRLHKMNGFNRMDEVCTHEHSFLSHGKPSVSFLSYYSRAIHALFPAARFSSQPKKMKYKSMLTYVWFRHQGHLGPVPKLTEVNQKPATHPGDSGSEPESIFHSEFLIYCGVGFFSIFIILCFLKASLLLFLILLYKCSNSSVPHLTDRQAIFRLHQSGVDRNLAATSVAGPSDWSNTETILKHILQIFWN